MISHKTAPPPLAVTDTPFARDAAARFASWAEGLPDAPLFCGHHDADGLTSLAILARAWAHRFGAEPGLRIVGRGENAWTPEFAATLPSGLSGLVLLDLGLGPDSERPADAPLCVIDHHVPRGSGLSDALVLSGEGESPVPSTSLIAWWAARGLAGEDAAEDWLWLAAVGAVGDMADEGFPEIDRAKHRRATKLRSISSLVNAPRRSETGDAAPALAWLRAASSAEDALKGDHPAREECEAARESVKRETAQARRQPPHFGSVYGSNLTVIRADSPCQIHPLIAQSWAGRLRPAIVFAANAAIEPGRVSFSGRTKGEASIIELLARHRPEGADLTRYGNGHRQAAGGSLTHEEWNSWTAALGFGEAVRVEAEEMAAGSAA